MAHEGDRSEKELRLAFAMGGGISLGTFSGAALSEALKLAVFESARREKYSRVVVDVLSGASAGAISLAIMLRALAHPSREQRSAARKALEEDLRWPTLSDPYREGVIAAQTVQELQRKIWVEELSLDLLLHDKGGELRHQAGIFNRYAIDRLAKQYIQFDGDTIEERLTEPMLLGSRVLFACTLANLSPIMTDETRRLPGSDVGFAGLMDAMRSGLHQEVRVFDLNFREVPVLVAEKGERQDTWPSRWRRYHLGADRSGEIGDLRKNSAWSSIVSTAIAAGALPVAFEPVVLSRERFEFGDSWPQELEEIDCYPFTYVDGGLFNNEPLREAFRLAAYLDSEDDPAGYERRVIFVDPAVTTSATDYAASGPSEYRLEPKGLLGLAGIGLSHTPSLPQVFWITANVGSAVLSEARVKEGHRAASMKPVLEGRDKLREMLAELEILSTDSKLLPLKNKCIELLEHRRRGQVVPPGPVTLRGALTQMLRQGGIPQIKVDAIDETLRRIDTRQPIPEAASWLKLFMMLAVELIADTAAKRSDAKVIAIAPIINPDAKTISEVRHFDLGGEAMFGFAGFVSNVAAKRDFEVGSWCAHNYLYETKLIVAPPPLSPSVKVPESDRQAIAESLVKAKRRIIRRVSQMATDYLPGGWRFLRVLSPLLRLAGAALWNFAEQRLTVQRGPYELRILTTSKRRRLDGPQTFDNEVQPIAGAEDSSFRIITFASHDVGSGWSGVHVRDGKITVFRRGLNPLHDLVEIELRLPSAEEIANANLIPNPVFVYDLDRPEKGWLPESGLAPLDLRLL